MEPFCGLRPQITIGANGFRPKAKSGSTGAMSGIIHSTLETPDAWKALLVMRSECALSIDCLITEPEA